MFTVRVRDVMTTLPITAKRTASFKEVADLMLRHGIGALPVVDDTGALLGMISEADLMTKPAHGGPSGRGRTAGVMMSAPAESVQLDDTLRDVAGRMISNHRRHLPVVDTSRRLVGVVSRRDVLRMFDRPDAELAADVSDALSEDQTLAGQAISVTAKDGVVKIEGTVRRVDDVARANRRAWMVPCVVDVVCHLNVCETAPGRDFGQPRLAPDPRRASRAHTPSAAGAKESAVRRIVVGVDGSAASRRALQWAVDQAHTCGAQVEAIHAWAVPDMGADLLTQALADPDELEGQARRELSLAVDGADEGGLVGPVSRTLVRDDAAKALIQAGKGADLLVVGSRGLGANGDAELGSVSHRVIRDAQCPVVVVPATS
jgi:CBS domain-containing protein/nucleotide-binding universal stress UspA family protein